MSELGLRRSLLGLSVVNIPKKMDQQYRMTKHGVVRFFWAVKASTSFTLVFMSRKQYQVQWQ